jgi:hypothetical protein
MGLFDLKIGWDIAGAFLTETASMILPPDLEYSGSNCNQYVSSPFGHFWHFFVFNTFDDTICLTDCRVLSPNVLSTNCLFSLTFAALARTAVKMLASIIARTTGGSLSRML